MIIDAITLNNFGLFRGKHELVLTPPSPKKPVVLIGGLNGRGKTTLLDALQLALYGKRARCSNRGSLAYKEYLKNCIHRGEASSAVELQFTTRDEGQESEVSIRRSWTSASSTGDSLTVYRDGQRDAALEDGWDEYVELLLPVGIAPLFFFDGEKIEKLADPSTSREILTTAITSLLGVDLLERLGSSLRMIEKAKLEELDTPTESQELDKLEAKIAELSSRIDELQLELREAKERGAGAQRAAEDASGHLLEASGEHSLATRRLLLEHERADLMRRIAESKGQLVELAAGAAPLLLVEPLLRRVQEQADREAAAAESEATQALLEGRDKEILRFLEETDSIRVSGLGSLDEYLHEDRLKRQERAATDTFLEMPHQAHLELRAFLMEGATPLRQSLEGSRRTTHALEQELQVVEGRLEAIPHEDAVAELETTARHAAQEAERARGATEALTQLLHASRREFEDATRSRRVAMEKDVSARFANDSSRRIHEYSRRTRGILDTFASALVSRNSDRISALILDSLQQLLGKPGLVGAVELDHETFDVSLRDDSGVPLSPDRLSAGERQLLAVAILWGLARLSGRPLPTVIDTPLGRLDSEHRANLVERYFPRASHQVLLLSTDEEINQIYYPAIEHAVGRSYVLKYDAESRSTHVEPGYFW